MSTIFIRYVNEVGIGHSPFTSCRDIVSPSLAGVLCTSYGCRFVGFQTQKRFFPRKASTLFLDG